LPDDRDGGPDTTRSEAVQLFLQAARAALSGFNPDPSGLEAIAEICRRLDGLPLAIELAAARCRYFTPEALLPRLANRLDVLSGTRRDLPARQQTLRQAFDWSYALLPANEQALFAQLGVFAGGFGPEIVERVCRPEGSDEWRGAPAELESLHESGLLEAGRTPDGEPRFEMLQTVREYAQARLAERGETEAVRRRHALGYLWLAEMANPRLTSPDQTRWLDRLEQSSDNFRLALQWAEDHQEPAVMLRLTSALWRYWNINLHLEEGHRWLSRSLAMAPEAAEDAPELVQARLESLFGLGRITLSQGKTSRAREELLEGLAAATRQDDPHWIGSMSTQLGHISFSLCEYDEARRYHERALELRRRLEESWPTGISLHSLGRVAFAVGDYEAARGYFEEAIGYLRESSTPPEIGRALAELARTYAALGDRERARALYDECRRLCQDAGEGASTQVLVWLAPAALALGEHDQALAFYQSILKVFNRIGHRRMVTICLEGIAVVLAAQDEQRAAARLLGAAGRLREEIDNLIQRPERLAIERAREQARSHLGEAAFHDAWEAGRALTLEQAIDEALKIPPPPTPSPELGRGDLSRSSCRLRS
ncbi:MAG TPA: tetratricopeptide repeat protein, partial [Thermomicrobiaceae bacterium]|nr:tetratricopeptide repeat protein [Thermomicrobiaceae bacterium]